MLDNWVLSPLTLVDKDGGKIACYRLFLDGGWGVGEFFAWITANILYLPVVIPSAYASQILAFVINPTEWLAPIEHAWTAVTSELFAFMSPIALLAAVLLGSVLVQAIKARNSTEGLRVISQRIVAASGMYLLITTLLYNPVGSLLTVLTGWVNLLGGTLGQSPMPQDGIIASDPMGTAFPTMDDAATAAPDSAVLTEFLRPLTWMLNYGSQLSPECGKAWAKMIEHGGELSCLTSSQVSTSQNIGLAFGMTIVAWYPVWVYFRFALVTVVAFVTHLALAVIRFASAAAMAAVSIWEDRPLDEFMRFLISAAANLIVASGIVGIARLGPGAAVSIADMLTDVTLIHFVALVFAYYLLAAAVWGLEKRFGPIRDWLMNNAKATGGEQYSGKWKYLFPGGLNTQATAFDRMISGIRHAGSQWATEVRERFNTMADPTRRPSGPGSSPLTVPAPASTVSLDALPPDTPESTAAFGVVNTYKTTTIHPEQADADTAPRIRSILARLDPRRPATPTSSTSADPDALPTSAKHAAIPAAPQEHPLAVGQPHVPTSDAPAGPPAIPALSWRARLQHDTRSLTTEATAAAPDLMTLAPVRLNHHLPATPSTLNDPRGNALAPMEPNAPLAAHLARITYLEIVLRALGWSGEIDASAGLPETARFFSSGIDENGNWTTQFYGK